MTAKRRAHIFMVDDDPADIALMEDYLGDADFEVELSIAEDGEDAMQQLRGGLEPDIILLDLNMPRKGGFSTLEDIRADDDLKDLKVIVFTTSDQEDHIMKAFEGGSNSFVTKPAKPDEFEALISMLKDYLAAFVWDA